MDDVSVSVRPAADESALDVRPVTSRIGAEIFGVDFRQDVSEELARQLQAAFVKHLVLFFRDQDLDADRLEYFGRIFGRLENKSPVKNAMQSNPYIKKLHFDENSKYIAGEKWHADLTCNPDPPKATGLNLHIVPDVGGDTCFASMYAAYDALSPAMKALLDPLTAIHDGGPLFRSLAKLDDNGEALFSGQIHISTHPVISTHPSTGRKSLYVNETFTTRIVELEAQESRHLLSFLFEHVRDVNFQCRFKWRKHSMALWDNHYAQHLAINDYFPAVRSGLRVTIAAEGAPA